MSVIRSSPRKTNPPCMKCKGTVSNVGSSGKRKDKYVYTYECHTCGELDVNGTWKFTRFTQVPPDDLDMNEVAQPVISKPRKTSGYKCRKCGLPKKGHTCLVTTGNMMHANKSAADLPLPPPVTTQSAQSLPKCILCDKTGTFNAGFTDTLTTCSKCDSVCVHFSCMAEFSMDWVCPLCR